MGKSLGNALRPGGRATAALVVCLAVVLAAAAAALAGRGRTATGSAQLAPESKQSANASCPTGAHSTTGGFVNPPGVPGAGFRSVTQVSNRLGRRGWSVTS